MFLTDTFVVCSVLQAGIVLVALRWIIMFSFAVVSA